MAAKRSKKHLSFAPPPKVVLARANDRVFTVPERGNTVHITVLPIDEPAGNYEFEGTVDVVRGRPMFRRVQVTFHEAASPRSVQALPWGRYAEAALEYNARDAAGARSYSEVRQSRVRQSRAANRRRVGEPRRSAVTTERLALVVELHDRAMLDPAIGRWDHYAAEQLGLSAAYVRALYGRATKENS